MMESASAILSASGLLAEPEKTAKSSIVGFPCREPADTPPMPAVSHRPIARPGMLLPGQDSNLEWEYQKLLCCQLHHRVVCYWARPARRLFGRSQKKVPQRVFRPEA